MLYCQNSQFKLSYTFGFFGRDPNADITVPFVPVTLVVIDGCIAAGIEIGFPNSGAACPNATLGAG